MGGDKTFDKLSHSLKSKIQNMVKEYPACESVFKEVVEYYETMGNGGEIDPKKQKINSNSDISITRNTKNLEKIDGTNIMLQLPDLSVQSPFRKRLNLVFGAIKGEQKAYLALTKSMDSKPELVLRSLTSDNVKFAAILNVPEKKPLRFLLVEYKSNEGDVFKNDPILIQFNNDLLEEQFGSILGGKTFVQYLTTQLLLVDFKVIDCTDCEDNFSVVTYKGSKEGHLYFLPNHVIFGFKKPIYIFNSTDIESITYTSITRLTFNINLDVRVNGLVEKFEFSMIDQKEFENIDKYVRTKDVRDNSMNDEHKAQKQLKNNTDMPGDLAEAAKLVPGGDQLIQDNNVGGGDDDDDDDDEDDDNYQIGDSDDDHSDNSGDDGDGTGNDDVQESGNDDDDDDEYEYEQEHAELSFTPGSFNGNMEGLAGMDENLQEELQDLQKGLDSDISELKKAGYL